MKSLSNDVARFALGKTDNEPLSSDEQLICDEWTSGEAADLMKVDICDPRLLEYAGLYDKLENKKQAVWDNRIA